MDVKRKSKLEQAGWKFGDYADFLGMTKKERADVESVLSSMRKHIDMFSVGQHDPDNSFLWKSNPIEQFEYWRVQNPDSTPIGFCEEVSRECAGHKFIAFVYEDYRGNRYHVHVPEEWKKLVS